MKQIQTKLINHFYFVGRDSQVFHVFQSIYKYARSGFTCKLFNILYFFITAQVNIFTVKLTRHFCYSYHSIKVLFCLYDIITIKLHNIVKFFLLFILILSLFQNNSVYAHTGKVSKKLYKQKKWGAICISPFYPIFVLLFSLHLPVRLPRILLCPRLPWLCQSC